MLVVILCFPLGCCHCEQSAQQDACGDSVMLCCRRCCEQSAQQDAFGDSAMEHCHRHCEQSVQQDACCDSAFLHCRRHCEQSAQQDACCDSAMVHCHRHCEQSAQQDACGDWFRLAFIQALSFRLSTVCVGRPMFSTPISITMSRHCRCFSVRSDMNVAKQQQHFPTRTTTEIITTTVTSMTWNNPVATASGTGPRAALPTPTT